nr:zinc finger MYM-type protein 1 [Tanacetum cinerariifolium]
MKKMGSTVYAKFIPGKFRVVSYNILAQSLAKSRIFPHSPSPCLRKETRMPVILDVLKNLNADILCLQRQQLRSQHSRRKGTTGIIFYYGESPISWSTQKQATVALSSCESEFIAATAAATQALWLKRLLSRLTHSDKEKITILVDNKLAITLMKNPVCYERSKHIDTKYHFIRECVERDDIQVYQYLVSGGPMVDPSAKCSENLPMPLCSIYAYTRGEPKFTNVTPNFTDTLDYILFTPSEGIKTVGYLELPEADAISVQGGLPNYSHPSDHLPIVDRSQFAINANPFSLSCDFVDLKDTGFDKAINVTKDIAVEMDIDPVCRQKRVIRKKRQSDENSINQDASFSVEEAFKVQYFLYIVDQALVSLRSRFEQYKEYEKVFGFLFVSRKLNSFDDTTLKSHCSRLEAALRNGEQSDVMQ